MVSAEEIKAGIAVALVAVQIVREKKSIPSGELYALLCGRVTIDGYNGMLRFLEKQNLISVQNHLVRWHGN